LDYSINAPYTTSEHTNIDGIIEVTNQTEDDKLIKNVHTIATFFKRELQYDSVPFPYDGMLGKPYMALLFTENDMDKSAIGIEESYIIYGACLFQKSNAIRDQGEKWVLRWVWLHPFFRNRGYFSKLWTLLEEKFGDFFIDEPVSADMKKFLKGKGSNHFVFDVP